MVGGARMIFVKIFHHMFVYVYVWVCVWIRTERLEAFMTKMWKIERKMNGKMHNHNNANTLENSRIAVYFSLPINNFLPFFLVNNVWFCVCAYMFEVEVVSGWWKKTQIWKEGTKFGVCLFLHLCILRLLLWLLLLFLSDDHLMSVSVSRRVYK